MIRGNELKVAEAWLKEAVATEKDPPPTEIQKGFIKQSRSAVKLRRRTRIIAVLVFLLIISFAGYAVYQRDIAIEQKRLGEINEARSIKQEKIAKEQERIAKEQEKIAKEQRDRAQVGVPQTVGDATGEVVVAGVRRVEHEGQVQRGAIDRAREGDADLSGDRAASSVGDDLEGC